MSQLWACAIRLKTKQMTYVTLFEWKLGYWSVTYNNYKRVFILSDLQQGFLLLILQQECIYNHVSDSNLWACSAIQ